MPTFDIWSEGYAATGESGPAYLMGKGSGATFREAVISFMESKPELKSSFNEETLTHWGCKLYDNEKDARAAFG